MGKLAVLEVTPARLRQSLTLLHPCRARMVRRVTEERMESQDSL